MSFHSFSAVEWRFRAAVLLLFVMSASELSPWSDFVICTKEKLCCYCPTSPYSRPVACASFYLYFSFTHLNIIPPPPISVAISLSVALLCWLFMSVCPLKTPFAWLFPHFLHCLSCALSVLLKCTFHRRVRSLTEIFSTLSFSWGTYSLFRQIWLPASLNLCESVCRGDFFFFWRGQPWQAWIIWCPRTDQTWHDQFCHMYFMISKQGPRFNSQLKSGHYTVLGLCFYKVN